MGNEHQRDAGIGGQRAQQAAERLEASSGSSDGDDGKRDATGAVR